jgi:hypothetical protein
MNECPREPRCELVVRENVVLDKRNSADRNIAVESDEREGGPRTATLGSQPATPEVEPIPILGRARCLRNASAQWSRRAAGGQRVARSLLGGLLHPPLSELATTSLATDNVTVKHPALGDGNAEE